MLNKIIKYLPVFFLYILFAGNVSAQNFNDALRLSEPGLGFNARALGMGNSYTAISDDYSAMYFNPAGLGLLKRMEFATGLNYYNYDNKSTFLGNTIDYSNSSTRLNNFSFAFPFPTIRGSLVFGLSYNIDNDFTSALKFDAFNPGSTTILDYYLTSSNADTRKVMYDLYLADPDTSAPDYYISKITGRLQQSGLELTSGRTGRWAFSGAVEVDKNVFVGATLNILSGNYSYSRDYYEDDTHHVYDTTPLVNDPNYDTRDFISFYQNRKLDWDISGWDAKIGVLYQFENQARFGFAIQFPKSYTIKENFNVSETSTFAKFTAESVPYQDEVQYDITTPYVLSAGASYSYKGLLVSAGGSFTDYSQMKFSNADNLDESLLDAANSRIHDAMKSVLDYNLGIEYNIPGIDLRIRGGYFVQSSPYRDNSSNYNKQYITTGLGILSSRSLAFDIAYVYGWWNVYGYDIYGYGNDTMQAPVSLDQKVKSSNLIFTASYRF